jgi:hypothetical protein
MYPLEEIYAHATYREFSQHNEIKSLKNSRQNSISENNGTLLISVNNDAPLSATSYTELVDIVSFLSIMNKRHTLYFRGQSDNRPPTPTIFRSRWKSLGGTDHCIPNSTVVRQGIWDHLNGRVSSIVLEICKRLPMPRRATLTMFREAVWAIVQHYEIWPTPLIDITPNLRIASSFALWGGRPNGYLYVVALPASTNSVTFDADQHVVLARLQAVCPPVAKRPHYQDGFLAGRFPFMGPNPNQIDNSPLNVSDISRRLIAHIILKDTDSGQNRRDRQPSGRGFWSDDFPRMSHLSLMPTAENDRLLDSFMPFSNEIDDAMRRICAD